MIVSRLRQIIEDVKNTPDAEFDMRSWSRRKGCGSVGCAIGSHCAAHPEAEIKLVYSYNAHGFDYYQPVFREWKEFEAAAHYCEISYAQSTWLFSPDKYSMNVIKKEHVIDRIEHLIERRNG